MEPNLLPTQSKGIRVIKVRKAIKETKGILELVFLLLD
jgi:hypothetical protein